MNKFLSGWLYLKIDIDHWLLLILRETILNITNFLKILDLFLYFILVILITKYFKPSLLFGYVIGIIVI